MFTSAKREAVQHSDPFKLVAVERCEPPQDGAPGTWCQYTIAQGDNVITCVRQGSPTAVKSAANEIVAVLNHRRADRRGRVHLVIAGKKS
jgi:hypothetical protein